MQIGALAEVVRSKNASPFRVTIDLFFADDESYEHVKGSGVLTIDAIASAYQIDPDQVEGIYFVDRARGIKVTIRKTYPSDHFRSSDCYGAQQHLQLAALEIPELATAEPHS